MALSNGMVAKWLNRAALLFIVISDTFMPRSNTLSRDLRFPPLPLRRDRPGDPLDVHPCNLARDTSQRNSVTRKLRQR